MDDLIHARALRAYERGRLWRALRFLPVAVVVGLSASLFVPWELALVDGTALAVLGVLGLRRGGSLGAGVWPGTVLGALPAVILVTASLFDHGALRPCTSCVFMGDPNLPALFGAVVAGACLAFGAPRRRRARDVGSLLVFAAIAFAPVCWWPFASVLFGAAVLGAAVVAVPLMWTAHPSR